MSNMYVRFTNLHLYVRVCVKNSIVRCQNLKHRKVGID